MFYTGSIYWYNIHVQYTPVYVCSTKKHIDVLVYITCWPSSSVMHSFSPTTRIRGLIVACYGILEWTGTKKKKNMVGMVLWRVLWWARAIGRATIAGGVGTHSVLVVIDRTIPPWALSGAVRHKCQTCWHCDWISLIGTSGTSDWKTCAHCRI